VVTQEEGGTMTTQTLSHEARPETAEPTAPIECRDVVKTYHTEEGLEVRALRGVTLKVARGEMVAIMGPSGCGKTTLLNCMSGLDDIDSGQILIDGTDISTMSDNVRTDFRARSMGFVFQFYNLLGVLTAAENVEMPLLLAGVASGEARERARRSLEMVGLPGRDNQLPASLSGGERQRVTIARALVNEPAIVWADEPTGDLDSKRADEIIELMRRLNQEQQITFAIVTHDIGIGRRADRIIRMADGQIVGEEYPA
jgi:putative ABC transport system ATP-binding protein